MKDVTRAPQLGNVTIARDTADTWAVLRNGERLASGLTFRQITAVIRGEIGIAELANGRGKGTDNRGKSA